jgi:hypothetical protein
LLFQGINVDMEDFGGRLWVALGVDPRDIAVEDDYDVGGCDGWLDTVPKT